MSTATCEPLEGNAEFYGLGIRIGVYLQWGAAWVSLLLDSESAQGVLDANSVSVFAVVVATIIAARRDAPAIEMYIMLQILLGFHITILSSFGIRIWLMKPNRLHRFLEQVGKSWRVEIERRKGVARRRAEEVNQRRESLRQKRDQLERRIHERELQRTPGTQRSATLAEVWDRMELLWLQIDLIIRSDSSDQVATPTWFTRGLDSGSTGLFGLLYLLWYFPVELLRLLPSLKFPGLSWSGVLWRTAVMALVMGYNLAYWFDGGLHGVNEPPADGCGSPVIFMFSMQQLLGTAMITLGRVSAALIAVVVIPPTLTLVILSFRIFFYAILFLYRDLIWFFVDLGSDISRFNESLGRVNEVFRKKALPLLEAVGFWQPLTSPFGYIIAGQVLVVRSMVDLIEFMSSTGPGAVRFSDVIKVGISLGMGNPVRHERHAQFSEPQPQQLSRGQTMLSGWEVKTPGRSWLKPTCFVWNVMVVLSIAYFIISIETTIRWNNIQGVNTIDSTGQLIPFIIGCISASQVIKKVVLLALGKYFPDWAETELEIEDGSDGPVISRIVKRSRDNTATGTPGDRMAEGVTTVENGSNSN